MSPVTALTFARILSFTICTTIKKEVRFLLQPLVFHL
nr:MAG TPA: hypothetical protein [Caudoviricetes sp.]